MVNKLEIKKNIIETWAKILVNKSNREENRYLKLALSELGLVLYPGIGREKELLVAFPAPNGTTAKLKGKGSVNIFEEEIQNLKCSLKMLFSQ